MNAEDPNSIANIIDLTALQADIEAALKATVSEMFGVAVDIEFSIGTGPLSLSSMDLFVSVGVTHESMIGSYVMSFPHAPLAAVLHGLYKKDLQLNEPGLAHGAGEIANISSGVLKDRLKKRGIVFKIALPQVTIGNSFRIPGNGTIIRAHCKSDSGAFDAYLVLQRG